MEARVDRETFLHTLESVQAGLSPREVIEQSSCFVFRAGEVLTFNDETTCRAESGLGKELEGAIQAQKFTDLLHKLVEKEIILELSEDSHLVVRGKGGRKAGIRMEADISLPVDTVEKPEEGSWKPLHEDFAEAVGIVQQCAGSDESQFALTCVNLHPKWVECTDNYQICRWRLRTGIAEAALVRQSAIKHIVSLGMSEFAETPSWLHFRSGSGLHLSCRRYLEDFPSLSKFLEVEGETIILPKGLGEAADKANIFSSENVDNNTVEVTLADGKLRIKGEGVSGWYTEPKKITYSGPRLKFNVAPQMLIDLIKKHNECVINAEKLKCDTGKFVYVACLTPPSDKAADDGEPEEESSKKKRKVEDSNGDSVIHKKKKAAAKEDE